MNPRDPFRWTIEAGQDLAAKGLLRMRRQVVPLPRGRCRLVTEQGESPVLWNFASNDYLGLAEDPRLNAAAEEATAECGTGARASALVTGRTIWHARLEQRLAEFKQTPAALLFPTGFAANVGTICGLVGPGDVVLCDRWNHASLVDGCRLSGAKLRVYPHGDVATVERELDKALDARRRLIVTDSLFSMDGDVAPLRELAHLAEQHDAMLLVDEAHATGVFGDRGTGLLEACGVESPHVIAVGTLSKALGSQGGFICGPKSVIDWLGNSARTQVYSTALTPGACGAALAALDIIDREPQRRTWLAERSAEIKRILTAAGWNVPSAVAGPIIPIIVGSNDHVTALAEALLHASCMVAAIRPPTVPRDTARLRISLNFAGGEGGITTLLDALKFANRPPRSTP
ncbi:MAG: 8-amino-7-oxononanoate synthase [Planctomycetaceae bacterium]|nr:8-amino-7-oxononanoate synthase [Planctomycetaceae bacterium]